jgi:hypothetical protein
MPEKIKCLIEMQQKVVSKLLPKKIGLKLDIFVFLEHEFDAMK